MAVTKIKPIKSTLSKALDYIENPDKTDGKMLVSSFGCSYETADIEFEYTLSQALQKGNNLAFHLIQSFEPGEVDYQKAHEIGKQLADAVTKGQHEYVLTTHIDKGHVHNHIIFCAVNFVDHRKYNSNKRSYYGIRNMSDKLCRENGLSVVVPGKGSKGKSYAEYQAEKTGTSWKGKLKIAVDALIPQVSSFEELLTRLQAAGYEIKPGKYVSCRAPGQERFTRLKTLGADYTEEAVRERIAGRRTKVAKAPREQRGVSLLIDIENSIKAAQSKGYEQWAKIHNLKQAAKTMNFLTEHKIEQYADLVSRIEEMAAESGQAADALKNAERNKKRTGITIVTLGAIGILFMVVATILSCAAPKEIARKDIESDYKIELETWGGDKMNPDRDWRQVQQNNPLTKAFIDQVRDVDGVEEVKVKTFMNGKIPKLSMDGEIWDADIIGLDASYAETLEKREIQGHVTYEELEKGDKILMSANMLYWFPELKVGDSLKMVLNMGDDKVEKTFEIGAIGDYYASLGGSSFYLPQSVLEKMNPNNLNYTLEITVNDQKKNSAYQELQALADNSEYLVTGSYEEQLQEWEKNMRLTSVLCYAFLIILGGIGIMNLVNTMMNSIYTRRRELGMIQAIGMSEKQLIRMLQLEGIIYTLGTLAVSVGIGSLVGYGAFLYAKTRHMFQISEYHFPVVPAVLLICAVAFLQVLLTYGVSANFRKLSLIDRIRYAE